MRRIFVLLILALCIFGSPVRATININVDAVQKSVVFLYGADATGAVDKNRALGTGFLVSIPLKSDATRSYRMLVTARHILDPVWAQCPTDTPKKIYARLNRKSSVSGVQEIDFIPVQLLQDEKPLWAHHSQGDIDAAVVGINIDDEIFDVISIPVELFPTEQELAKQSIGDPVMSAGLLLGLTGNTRNYPIFKFGQISNIPTEDVETGCSPQSRRFYVKVWLIAANLVPGNSGSPIFHVPLGGSGVVIRRYTPDAFGCAVNIFYWGRCSGHDANNLRV